MKKEIAQEIINLSIDTNSSFNQILVKIKDECEENEFKEMRKGIAYVLGYLLTDVMNPVFKKYPELIPEELKDSYSK